jgi:PhnB protein
MHVQPYLNFSGRCDEALEFYTKAIGAEVEVLMRWKDCPDKSLCSEGNEQKVMHARVRVGNARLMASDGRNSGQPNFAGIMLSLSTDSESDAHKLFAGLAEGGKVQMPLGKTFFSPCFGMVMDKFGVGWMIVVAQ